jgi:hypothetical protein
MHMARVIEFYNRLHLRASVDGPRKAQWGKIIPFMSHHGKQAEIVYEAALDSTSSPWLDSSVDESTQARSPGRIIFQISESYMTPEPSAQGTDK